MFEEYEDVVILDHPYAAAQLSILRAWKTSTDEFRRNLQALSVLLFAEASRAWPTEKIEIETPLQACAGVRLARPVVLVPILRAGLGMLDGISRVLPDARIGHLGLYRDEETLRPVTYYSRLPARIADAQILLLDPMLATGQSACEAVSLLKANGGRHIQLLCVVACPRGIARFGDAHPGVQIVTAAVDPVLNRVGYIVPGLGDAGDRYFGTEQHGP